MSIAEKIVMLRKKNAWSQEELAERMNVSRQAVSKWESGQALPDTERIVMLSEIFDVSTDYLLRDPRETDASVRDTGEERRYVSAEMAEAYLELRKRASVKIALATFLCILSPITLLILGGVSELGGSFLSEAMAGAIGLGTLFAFVLCAVPMFALCGFQNAPYEFLEKNVPFSLSHGVRAMVEERKRTFRDTYVLFNLLGTCICVFSPVPLIVSAFAENELLCVIMLGVTLAVAGIGVVFFILAGVQNASMEKLLQEGEFSPKEKKRTPLAEAVGSAYWGLITLAYLAWSFLGGAWHVSWILFVAGGVLFPLVLLITNGISDKKNG
ncbi:MAG: helix-turn-helix transcriptional regulator [Ruminococcaceae bacterium]|nr:helix-turn-helix transcriptional regulator [Oscillospiraceae bacterium]